LLCSDRCRFLRAAKAKAFRIRPNRQAICKGCTRPFTLVYGTRRRTFCSKQCLRVVTRRINKALRKARLKSAPVVERIDPYAVFARDGWCCQLCGCSTPKRLRGLQHDRSPELDHILPLGAGGTHTWTNVQCACRKCNIAKADKPLGQLRLS
jgi:5-methylcytosine-specific restriction endonuclease McrA